MKKLKAKLAIMMIACFCALVPYAVYAEEPSGGTANQAVVTAMTSLSNDMIATGNSIIPIALTVIGLAMVVIFGVRMFKKVSGQRG